MAGPLRFIEVNDVADYNVKIAKNNNAMDAIYLLKYCNTILMIDNGVKKYFNAIKECTATEYAAITTKEKCFYQVKKTDGSYDYYYQDLLMASPSLIHSHSNKAMLDLL